MGKRTYKHRILLSLLMLGLVVSIVGCGELDNVVTISYTLPLVPITFSIDTDGHISVSVSANIVTELGEVDVAAGSSISVFPVSNPDTNLLLTIRHKQDGALVDSGYQIKMDKVGSADVRGKNFSEVKIGWNGKNNTLYIDASHGNITSIVIEGAASASPTPGPAASATAVPSPPPASPTPPGPPSPTPSPYPTLAKSYGGFMDDPQQSVMLALTAVIQDQDQVSGNFSIGSPFLESGVFTGNVTSDGKMQFVANATDGSNVYFNFSGVVQADGSLSGTYSGSNGLSGTWQALPDAVAMIDP